MGLLPVIPASSGKPYMEAFSMFNLSEIGINVFSFLWNESYSLDSECEKLKNLAFRHVESNIEHLDEALSAKMLLRISHNNQEWTQSQILSYKPLKEDIRKMIEGLFNPVKRQCVFSQDKQIELSFGILMKTKENLFSHWHFGIKVEKGKTDTITNASASNTRHKDLFLSWSKLITPNHASQLIDEKGNFT
jgi:hypothetical protein